MKRTTNASPAQVSLAMTTKPRRRSAIAALFTAAIVLLLALPALGSADPLGKGTFYNSGLRSTAFITTNTLGPDGNIWFIDNKGIDVPNFAPAIGRITPSGEIKEYISPTTLTGLESESSPNAIVAGPGGSKYLWFTDRGPVPAIGVIDSANPETVIAEFSIEEKGGNPESSPVDITVGPDGNLWFTDMKEETPAIGKIVLSSETEIEKIEEFSTNLNPFESRPLGIVAGPDGNLWFTDPNEFAPAIGKIDPNNPETSIEEFPTGEGSVPGGGNAENGPWGIAAGPDGNVWFTENGSNETEGRSPTGKAIGRIEPSGAITYFNAGLIGSSQPTALTAAAGKLWFTDNSGVNEEQEVKINATENLGGTYKLGFGGKETGATGSGNVLSEGIGKGDVKRFPTTGTKSCKRTAGSKELKECNSVVGAEVGMRIEPSAGTSIPAETTITKIEGSTIFISNAATSGTNAATNVQAGWITGVETTSGKFEVGQPLTATGFIASENSIISVGEKEGKGTITPSKAPTAAGTAISLSAGAATSTKTILTNVTTSTGAYSVGETISGKGIPASTTIKAINTNLKTLELTATPTEAGTGVELTADLGFDATGPVIAEALKKLSTIGAGGVSGSGLSTEPLPIKRIVTFEGALESTDVEQLSCNGAGLKGTSPSCTVTTTLQGVPNAIGCITASGEACGTETRWPLAGLNAKGFGITLGSDGNLWVSTGTGTKAKIGKFGIEAEPNLKLNVEEGSGTVVSNPAGLECTKSAGGSCEAAVAEGKVTLTASPAPGYAFKSWKGCETGGAIGRQCTVTATSSLKSVGVKFYKVWNLAMSKSNPNGIASTSPGGVNCGYGCLSSAADYKPGSLTLKAKPAKNFHFVEFSGGTGSASSCNGVTAETCAITIGADSSIEEVYAENAKNTLTLTKTGGGQAFVKTKPTNVNCGYTCGSAEAEFFASETAVPVTVALNKGTTSVTWSGGTGATTCTSNQLSCTVDMSSDQTLTAEFK